MNWKFYQNSICLQLDIKQLKSMMITFKIGPVVWTFTPAFLVLCVDSINLTSVLPSHALQCLVSRLRRREQWIALIYA